MVYDVKYKIVDIPRLSGKSGFKRNMTSTCSTSYIVLQHTKNRKYKAVPLRCGKCDSCLSFQKGLYQGYIHSYILQGKFSHMVTITAKKGEADIEDVFTRFIKKVRQFYSRINEQELMKHAYREALLEIDFILRRRAQIRIARRENIHFMSLTLEERQRFNEKHEKEIEELIEKWKENEFLEVKYAELIRRTKREFKESLENFRKEGLTYSAFLEETDTNFHRHILINVRPLRRHFETISDIKKLKMDYRSAEKTAAYVSKYLFKEYSNKKTIRHSRNLKFGKDKKKEWELLEFHGGSLPGVMVSYSFSELQETVKEELSVQTEPRLLFLYRKFERLYDFYRVRKIRRENYLRGCLGLLKKVLDLRASYGATTKYVSGSAGSGKTTMLRSLKREAEKQGLSYLVVAPTGKAASLVKGETVQRAFRFDFRSLSSYSPYRVKKVDGVLIDEASMLGVSVFLQVLFSLRIDIPVWLFGDVKQLSPVSDLHLRELLDYMDYQELNNQFRFGEDVQSVAEDWENWKKYAKRVKKLKSIDWRNHGQILTDRNWLNKEVYEILKKEGRNSDRYISMRNFPEKGIKNGEIRILKFWKGSWYFGGTEIEIEDLVHFEPADSITVWKAQGSEFDYGIIVFSEEPTPELWYTAVTRFRSVPRIYYLEKKTKVNKFLANI